MSHHDWLLGNTSRPGFIELTTVPSSRRFDVLGRHESKGKKKARLGGLGRRRSQSHKEER
jgi:hypothetical protein